MSRTKNYIAVFERDPNDVWLVHVEGVDGCQTYGRSIRQATALASARPLRRGSTATPTS